MGKARRGKRQKKVMEPAEAETYAFNRTEGGIYRSPRCKKREILIFPGEVHGRGKKRDEVRRKNLKRNLSK